MLCQNSSLLKWLNTVVLPSLSCLTATGLLLNMDELGFQKPSGRHAQFRVDEQGMQSAGAQFRGTRFGSNCTRHCPQCFRLGGFRA